MKYQFRDKHNFKIYQKNIVKNLVRIKHQFQNKQNFKTYQRKTFLELET